MSPNDKTTLKVNDDSPPSKPPSAIDDATGRLLDAIQRVDDKLDRKIREDEERFDQHGRALRDLAGQVTAHNAQLAELATAQVSTAKAASEAAAIATRAMAMTSTSADDTRKMVESAMTIQRDAITGAVRDAVKPIADKVTKLEANDEQQAQTLQKQDDQLMLVVELLSTVANWRKHWAFRVAFLVGGAIAGYLASRGH